MEDIQKPTVREGITDFLDLATWASLWSLAIGPLMLVWQCLVWLRTGNWPNWSIEWLLASIGMGATGWVGVDQILASMPVAFVLPLLSLGLVSIFLWLHDQSLPRSAARP